MKTEKDIVLILGEGGMMGIFIAGVLAGLDEKIRDRVSAVYGTSSGADVGAYFVAGQMEIPSRFFTEYLTRRDFIRKNFLRYIAKIFFFRNNPNVEIKDYLNVDYVIEVAKHSDCKLDLGAFEKSDMEFYIKVIDIASAEAIYLPAKQDVFEKMKATSQCGPLSTKAIEIDGRNYIDGGTFPSMLDLDLVQENKNKVFIVVQSQKDDRFRKALLYPLYLLAAHAISLLYGKRIGKKYRQNLFVDHARELASQENVIFVQNDLCYSSFCTDKKKLRTVYEHGMEKGRDAL